MASTRSLTYYYIHPKRGIEAVEGSGILPPFTGYAIHNKSATYCCFGLQYSQYNEHHLRELFYTEEQYNRWWATRLQTTLLQAEEEVYKTHRREWSSVSQNHIASYERRYSHMLRLCAEEPTVLAPSSKLPKRKRSKQQKAKYCLTADFAASR